jgi:predicted SnoaL-like aldol condensation-catalyzing enzyme
MAIEALTGSEDNIHALGATHVAIGPPPGDSRQRGRLDMFPMAILIDRGLRVCSTYGLTIELPDDLRERYAMAVYVPPNASENGKWLVPIPATPLAVPFCALESLAARGCVNRCHSNKGPRYSNKGLQLVSKDIEEDNKRLVLDALDTLFNKRNFEAAERFWSPNYIQHGAHIPPGREGLFNLIRSVPVDLRYEPRLISADGEFVMIHGRFSGTGRSRNWIAADIVRIANGLLVEHWGALQYEATHEEPQSGRPMFGASRGGDPQGWWSRRTRHR